MENGQTDWVNVDKKPRKQIRQGPVHHTILLVYLAHKLQFGTFQICGLSGLRAWFQRYLYVQLFHVHIYSINTTSDKPK